MMMVAAVACVSVMCSCSSDDDETEAPVASMVAGSYSGDETVMVMGDETKETETYVFTKATDTSVDLAVPQTGEGGMMVIPGFTVKNIPLTKSNNTISGQLASYSGKVTDSKGAEKEYSVSEVTVLFSGQTVVVSFSLKYGTMPFAMATTFTGTKK